MATGNLASVVVAVDGSEESMNALQWALDNLRLRPDGELVVLHVQPPPNIAARINPVSPCSLVTVALVHLVRDRA
jgi:nucleotide-binding universal stress UspA family protein